MKAILISIKPEWVAKILNGEKTIEIRKTIPKCDLPIDVYIYCSKGGKKDWHLIEVVDTDTGWEGYEYDYYIGSKGYLEHCLEGKVVAKFTLNKVEDYKCAVDIPPKETISKPTVELRSRVSEEGLGEYYFIQEARKILEEKILKHSCLTETELAKYLEKETNVFSNFYAWHIDNLVIFDKPEILNNFKIRKRFIDDWGNSFYASQYLRKPPQSYCFVEKE